MTPAEFRSTREYLGFTGDEAAALLLVTSRQLRRWEAGTSPIPEGVAKDLAVLETHTDNEVRRIIELTMDSPDPAIVTYRTDAAFHETHPHLDRHTANWHRRLTARAARQVPGLGIIYSDEA